MVFFVDPFVRMQHRAVSSNRGQHILTGEILAASEIREWPPHSDLGRSYGEADKHLWQCANCQVKVYPRAWDGKKKYGKAANFWAPSGHEPGCKPDPPPETPHIRDGHDPRCPVEFVSHLILTPLLRSPSDERSRDQGLSEGSRPQRDEDDHNANSERHLRPVCNDFIAVPGILDEMLRIDRSPSQPYWHWFVRLGSGGNEILDNLRVFYAEMRFVDQHRINWDAVQIIVPLQSFVGGRSRSLIIDTTGWPDAYRSALKDEFIDALKRGRTAWPDCAERPWVFFVGQERSLMQTEYYVSSEAAVCAIACTVPDQNRPIRRYPAIRPWPVAETLIEQVPPHGEAIDSFASNPPNVATSTFLDITAAEAEDGLAATHNEPASKIPSVIYITSSNEALHDVIEVTDVAMPLNDVSMAEEEVSERAALKLVAKIDASLNAAAPTKDQGWWPWIRKKMTTLLRA